MAAPPLPASLGHVVTKRDFSLEEMVSREWGSSFRAPDHRIYNFQGRGFDSTDIGTTGFYKRGNVPWTLDEEFVTLGTPADTLDGSIDGPIPPGGGGTSL